MAEMFAHMATLDRATTERDTKALLPSSIADPAADGQRVGAVGYCMGGPLVMWAAADFPDRLACIASIHGANMATDRPDSPHRWRRASAARATSPAPRSTSGRRPPTSTSSPRRCAPPARRTASSGIPAPSTASYFPTRVGAYHRDAAERHYERLFAALRSHPAASAGLTLRGLAPGATRRFDPLAHEHAGRAAAPTRYPNLDYPKPA
jgi:carboxymethylenebutenolidase